MRVWVKTGMYLSAYFPLFLLLMVLNDFHALTILLFIVSLIGTALLGILLYLRQQETSEKYMVASVENISKDVVSYIVPYLISLVNYDLSKGKDLFLLLFLLILLLIIYIRGDLLYINPLLLIFGYHIYRVRVHKILSTDTKNHELILLSKGKTRAYENITIINLDGDLYIRMI